ncbi:hypothetical protein ACLK19_08670 [Escherichia coli]
MDREGEAIAWHLRDIIGGYVTAATSAWCSTRSTRPPWPRWSVRPAIL